jgi:nitrate/nitrite transport system substrate-binding protein
MRCSEPCNYLFQATALKKVIEWFKAAGKQFKMGMVFPLSTHNDELRYWLAAGGIHPGYYSPGDITGQTDAEGLISVTPPPQMPATLESGTIHGYCVGEPWNQQTVFKGIGIPVITAYQIWKNNPEKVFGVSKAWADKYPKTHVAVVKALIRAGMWLDANQDANRQEAAAILSQPNYVGADVAVLANSMTGTFAFEKDDKRPLPDFNVFFRYFATYSLVMLSGTSCRCGAGARLRRVNPTPGIRRRPSRSTGPMSTCKRRGSSLPKARRRRPTSR